MKNIISTLRNKHAEIYKGFLVLIAFAAIVYVFPKQITFQYEFENLKGKPWTYEKLTAPFDFAIRKTKQELKAEKEAIIKSTNPYYKMDVNVEKEQRLKFIKSFNEGLNTSITNKNKHDRDNCLAAGKFILKDLYNIGIIKPDANLENKDQSNTLLLLVNNIAEERQLKDLLTVSSAQQYIKEKLEKLPKDFKPEFLLPLLEDRIAYSVTFDKETTNKVIQQSLDEISLSYGVILKDQAIISKGELLDETKYQILSSLKLEYEEQSGGSQSIIPILIGQSIIVAICLFILLMFLSSFRKDMFDDNNNITFVLLLVVLEVLMAKLAVNNEAIHINLLPFCILPIVIRSFFDTRIALFVHLITIFIISFMVPNPFEFMFIQIIAGIITIFSIINMQKRSQIFVAAALIFFVYSVSFISINIIRDGGLEGLHWMDFVWFAISASLILFSYPLIFIFEKLFGFISDVSILELSDTNGKLLRELATKAPGTFQHSLQVANLAEEAIYNIGGNPLMVRTGALYHDIGKMENPLYFIENQAGGVNPHDELNYEDSAKLIIDHVIKGIEIAKKHRLPEQIIDFIRTHHGTTLTAYFYRSHKNEFPEMEIEKSKFQYPGPIPFSKETAVLMMADSVEAASRSLKTYDATSISNLVDNVINGQMEQEQFINADITFKNINSIKKIFKKKLMNIYHVRVEYPS